MQFESKKSFQKGSQRRFLEFLVKPPLCTMGVEEEAEDICCKTQRSHEERGALNKQSNSCFVSAGTLPPLLLLLSYYDSKHFL